MNSADVVPIAFRFVDRAVRTQSGWVAGFYYLRACLNAFTRLPDEHLPKVVALVPKGLDQPLILHGVKNPPWLEVCEIDVAEPETERRLGLEDYVGFPVSAVSRDFAASIGWIPDFQHLHYPEFFDRGELDVRQLHYSFLAGYCDRIACNSSNVLSDFVAQFPRMADKGELLSFAVTLPDDVIAQDPTMVLRRLGIAGLTYAYIPNQFWAHKNHRTAFEAWRRVHEHAPEAMLVCSGGTEDYRRPDHYATLMQFVRDAGLESSIIQLGMLSRADQLQVLRGARCVVQPSLFEGWSTSVEEAKALGVTLVASDIAVHHEQCGANATYFPALDADALARELIHMVKTPAAGNLAAEARSLQQYEPRIEHFAGMLIRAARHASAHATANNGYSAEKDMALDAVVRQAALERAQYDSTIHRLNERLAVVEADRVARLDALNSVTARMVEVEADRAARLQTINVLTNRLAEIDTDRAARLERIDLLTRQLAEVEADRAARLNVIETLVSQNQELEEDRAARLEKLNILTRQLDELQAEQASRTQLIDALSNRIEELKYDLEAKT